MLLALDTSTRLAGIALYDAEHGLLAEHNWHSANQHTVELIPQVSAMLAQARVEPSQLSAVAVALGPGSFTGVRVALAAAKGLALANRLALIGIPTLDVVAYAHSFQPLPVVAIVQAGRGRVCWAVYEQGANGWAARTSYRLSTIGGLAATIDRPVLFAGEMYAATRLELSELLGERAHCLPPALALRRAGWLGELGWHRLTAGLLDDLAALTPIYLHEPAPGGQSAQDPIGLKKE